jgi:hypothetical protein
MAPDCEQLNKFESNCILMGIRTVQGLGKEFVTLSISISGDQQLGDYMTNLHHIPCQVTKSLRSHSAAASSAIQAT